ncbi:MAG TPA: Rieske 2Fe-2S domain-containing protein [Hanamia sp.]|jgi:nitrite reductase/ring-hydroxylating ferredoxin subunit|nr:Rieske 2Fe-2S domain-containing protein [Hanamia sp.]
METNQTWTKIANSIDEIHFGENNIASINIDKKPVCVIKTADGLRACSSNCPHAGADLSEGFLDKRENIICPVHNYRFNLNNGRDTNNEGYFLKIFVVKETEEGIFIEIT